MKYYIDTEFLEGPQTKRFMGIPIGKTKPTIDLISIGIVSEDPRNYYYAISKEFNLWEAWNRWQQRTGQGDRNNTEPKLYWIRDNVLKPLYNDLMEMYDKYVNMAQDRAARIGVSYTPVNVFEFNYTNLKWLINRFGKTREEMAQEIYKFIYGDELQEFDAPEFYAYYADYDWVVFCWIFGKMNDLPTGFPMYCRDMKQQMDFMLESKYMTYLPACKGQEEVKSNTNIPLEKKLVWLKSIDEYPPQINNHNALKDALWNSKLHSFLARRLGNGN